MKKLNKEQKIEFCRLYLDGELRKNRLYKFICVSFFDYFINKFDLNLSNLYSFICSEFPELIKNFPEGYTFTEFHWESFECFFKTYENQNEYRKKIIQKTLNDLLNENNNN